METATCVILRTIKKRTFQTKVYSRRLRRSATTPAKSDKQMAGIAAIRARNAAPRVAPTWWSEAESITTASEKIDLLAIMNCFAQEHPMAASADVETVTADYAIPSLSGSIIAAYDLEEHRLYQAMKARFGVRDSSDPVGPQHAAWPAELPRPKRAKKASKPDSEVDRISALDRQLQALKDATTSVVDRSAGVTTSNNSDAVVATFTAAIEDSTLHWKERSPAAPAEQDTSLKEPFRAPNAALRQLVHDRLFLLDDHCMPCTVRTHSAVATVSGSSAGDGSSGTATSSWLSSKEQLLRKAMEKVVLTVPSDAPPAVSEADLKLQAVESALARHAEALSDAVLELVFKHCEGKLSAMEGAADIPAQPSGKKRKTTTAATATAAAATPPDVQRALFGWQDVLGAVASCRSVNVKVHQDLPSLHLNDRVRLRSQARLRALLLGEVPRSTLRTVPGVLRHDLDAVSPALPAQESDTAAAGVRTVEGEGEDGSKGGARDKDMQRQARRKRKKAGELRRAVLLPAVWDT